MSSRSGRIIEKRQRRPGLLLKWAALVFVVVGAGLIRVRLLNVPFERDEGEYAYQGALTLAGVAPYTHVYTQKLPGTHLLYALSMAVFGQTMPERASCSFSRPPPRASACFSWVGASCRSAGRSPRPPLTRPCRCPPRCSDHSDTPRTSWRSLRFGAARARRRTRARRVPALPRLGIPARSRRPHEAARPGLRDLRRRLDWIGPPGRKARCLVVLLAGAALPMAVLLSGSFGRQPGGLLVLGRPLRVGVRHDAGTRQRVEHLRFTASRFLPQAFLLWVMAAAGAGLLLTPRFSREARLRLGSLAILSFLGVCPACTSATTTSFSSSRPRRFSSESRSSGSRRFPYSGASPSRPPSSSHARSRSGPNGKPSFVRRLTRSPGSSTNRTLPGVDRDRALPSRSHDARDTIVVFGSEPEIPFYARRHSATGFVFMYPLMQTHRDTHALQERMVREVEAARPAYAVLVKTPTSWLNSPIRTISCRAGRSGT